FLNLTWLAVFARVAWRARALPRDGPGLLKGCLPALRLGVALFYAIAFLWKLNHDFFRAGTSCAATGWARVAAQFGWVPDRALATAAIWSTLLFEGLGFLLLLVPRTRSVAVLALVGFHTALGLDIVWNFLNFSSAMFALLVLFLEPEALARARTRLAALARGPAAARVWAVAWVAIVLFV